MTEIQNPMFLGLGNFNLDIVSDFDIRISNLKDV